MYFYATKVLCIRALYNGWFRWWSGNSDCDINKQVDSEILNECLYAELFLESLPQFITQLMNNVLLNSDITNWGTVPI